VDNVKSYLIILIISIFTALYGCAAPTTIRTEPNEAAVEIEAAKQREIVLMEAIGYQERLNQVGWPLMISGLPLCIDRKRWSLGLYYSNKYDFKKEMQDTAVSVLGMGEVLQIIFLAENLPSAGAGLIKGDLIMTLNGQSVPIGEGASKKYASQLKDAMKDGEQVEMEIRRNGIRETVSLTPIEVCDYPLVLTEDDFVNAFADGNQIIFTQGMMDFAKTDGELSLVIAHELAHNNMRHIDARMANASIGLLADLLFAAFGVNTQGLFSKIGAQAYSKEFESEADYVGLYIVARAGGAIDNSAHFWRRMGVKHPGSIQKNHAASHPSSPERFVSIEDTIKEIEQKHELGQELMPNIDEGARKKREPPPKTPLSFGS
jgi:hypothetical protein